MITADRATVCTVRYREACQSTSAVLCDADASGPDMESIKHFVRCARAGRRPASSSAEQVAQRLAKCLRKIGDDLCLLDGSALRGFIELARLMNGPWPTDAVKESVFSIVDSTR